MLIFFRKKDNIIKIKNLNQLTDSSVIDFYKAISYLNMNRPKIIDFSSDLEEIPVVLILILDKICKSTNQIFHLIIQDQDNIDFLGIESIQHI